MKAYFGRKMLDVEELRDATERAKFEGFPASAYMVTAYYVLPAPPVR